MYVYLGLQTFEVKILAVPQLSLVSGGNTSALDVGEEGVKLSSMSEVALSCNLSMTRTRRRSGDSPELRFRSESPDVLLVAWEGSRRVTS